jgi:hypothetical protein
VETSRKGDKRIPYSTVPTSHHSERPFQLLQCLPRLVSFEGGRIFSCKVPVALMFGFSRTDYVFLLTTVLLRSFLSPIFPMMQTLPIPNLRSFPLAYHGLRSCWVPPLLVVP